MASNHLLIGGAGAVGRRLLRALTARGNRVVVADFTKEHLPEDYFVNKHIDQQGVILKQVYEVDVRDRSAVFDAMEQASAFVNSPVTKSQIHSMLKKKHFRVYLNITQDEGF